MLMFFYSAGLLFRLIYTLVLFGAIAYSLYCIAQQHGVPNAWIAFVPIFQYYIIGSLCEEYEISTYRIRKLQWVMVLLAFLQLFLGFIGGLIYIPLRILVVISLSLIYHKFIYMFSPKYATVGALFCLFGQLPLAVVLFLLKDRPMLMSAAAYPYPFKK